MLTRNQRSKTRGKCRIGASCKFKLEESTPKLLNARVNEELIDHPPNSRARIRTQADDLCDRRPILFRCNTENAVYRVKTHSS
jgi:hypothetical protein